MTPLRNRPAAEFVDARKLPRPFRTAANHNGNVNNFMWVTRPNPHSTGERRPFAARQFYFAALCSHDSSLTHLLELQPLVPPGKRWSMKTGASSALCSVEWVCVQEWWEEGGWERRKMSGPSPLSG